MATRLDPLEYLERGDKWYLGGGTGSMYAPAFPRFLDAFGFWDESYFADVRLERLFTLLLLGENARPLPLRREGRRWTPDALSQTFATADGLRVREDKVVTESHTFGSRLTVQNEGKRARTVDVLLWSLQDHVTFRPGMRATSAERARREGPAIAFEHTVQYGEAPYADRPAENAGWGERGRAARSRAEAHVLHVAIGADREPAGFTMNLAERTDAAPLWQISVAPEKFRGGRLAGDEWPAPGAAAHAGPDDHGDGHLHLLLHYHLDVPVGETRAIQLGATVGLDAGTVLERQRVDLGANLAAGSRERWHRYFDGVPYFECSDPHVQKYYWYRWYGLRLLTVDIGGEEREARGHDGAHLPQPCVFEGIGGFRSHVSYSAQCHMLEASWMHDPALAQGCLLGILAAQEKSGFLPGHLYLWREGRGFYHANWGANALQLYHLSGDAGFVERVYPGLSRYADYFERDRDREDSHLYDVVDQGETGQEYSSRYLFASAQADDWRRIQLKGVDATVYVYGLQRALGEMAAALGREEEAAVWHRKADATRDAVRERMWDAERGFFFDVDPRTGERSPYKAAVGLYPFLTDIAGPEHLPAIRDHLLNPQEFWTAWPVPASSADDPFFSAEAEWKGKRLACPWNGRVWPMTNSHACEALARAALTLDPGLRPAAASLLERFVRLLFFDGDPERPNCFEHYNPLTGEPCTYRGIDDYQHSWVVDLIAKYVVGLQPGAGPDLALDPLPVSVDSFAMRGIRYRGHSVDVRWRAGDGYRACVDGEERAASPERRRLVVPLGAGAGGPA
ncbi:MAG: hypothetical protein IT208_12140 [Chthonomonadales bacterium]|nr:hypothetical protein [Chthonomonadales bacterium]